VAVAMRKTIVVFAKVFMMDLLGSAGSAHDL
jgi:hypothetical protein